MHIAYFAYIAYYIIIFIFRIAHYEQRLRSLVYKKKFVTWKSEVESRAKIVMEASREVARSRRLKKLLEIVLALGNYMNKGARGNAYGFRLSSLNRLADTKSSSVRGTTLLHYIVDLTDKKVFNRYLFVLLLGSIVNFLKLFE